VNGLASRGQTHSLAEAGGHAISFSFAKADTKRRRSAPRYRFLVTFGLGTFRQLAAFADHVRRKHAIASAAVGS
jgi:hypothetical protein